MRQFWVILALSGCAAWAQSDHPNLSGTWQLDQTKSELHAGKSPALTWFIDEKENAIQMKQVEKDDSGKQREVDFNCGIGGKECSVKEPDGQFKASFWYNGPMLVEMKTSEHTDHIMKYRMKLENDGRVLNVEMTSIVPVSEKPDHLVFSKQ